MKFRKFHQTDFGGLKRFLGYALFFWNDLYFGKITVYTIPRNTPFLTEINDNVGNETFHRKWFKMA